MLKNPIIAALDFDDPQKALKTANEIGEIVGGLKIGPRLVMREGEKFISKLAERAPVFVDMKHFDIPSTMVAAVRASFEAGATLVTVHALAGEEALQKCAELEKELEKERPFKILAVTVLTSWTEKSYPPPFQTKPIAEHVASLASLARKSGLSGLVCSGHELSLLKDSALYKVVPGIRMELEDTQDQKRVMGPKQALKSGADALVVGRPIIEAKNIKEAALDYVMASMGK